MRYFTPQLLSSIALPVQAVQVTTKAEATVLVLDNENRIGPRHVMIGLDTPSEIEIRSGIRDGDLVVSGNQAQYKTGETVDPKEVEMPEWEQ